MDVRPHTLHWLQPRRAEFLEVCLLPLRGKAVADAGDFSLADVAG